MIATKVRLGSLSRSSTNSNPKKKKSRLVSCFRSVINNKDNNYCNFVQKDDVVAVAVAVEDVVVVVDDVVDDDIPSRVIKSISIGERIQEAKTVEEILNSASEHGELVLDGEELYHWQTQDVHKLKNKKASVNGLKRIAKMISGHDNIKNYHRNSNFEKNLARLIKGASLIKGKTASDNVDAIRAVASIVQLMTKEERDDSSIGEAFDALAEIIDEDFETLTIGERIVYDWSLRAVKKKIVSNNRKNNNNNNNDDVNKMPFRYLTPNISDVLDGISLEDLRREVPFKAEKLVTRDGKRVDERRQTCFVAEDGIGGLAYSGKIMAPTNINSLPLVKSIRDALVNAIAECDTIEKGAYFDCALLNLYPDGASACAWHCDPEMGSVWARESIIVSIGETRRFAFREMNVKDAEQIWVRVHHGDCIWMENDCNDAWEHCVFGQENETNNKPRISLVFKRALYRGNKKGHGLLKR
jgi:alkylated DNA repair dioxygenase AlkB